MAKTLKAFLALQEYHLAEDHKVWDELVTKIQKNPNQMNVMGVWQHEQLSSLQALRIKIHVKEQIVQELRNFIGSRSIPILEMTVATTKTRKR